MNNTKLIMIILLMIPIVVISFMKKNKTNFNLEEKESEENIVVSVLIDNEVKKLDLEEYIVGVVAAEMPASFNLEALKAQAVASRSYALYRKKHSKKEYDLTDNTNTQVYINKDKMLNKWGNKFDKYYARIKNAVDLTKGEVAVYDGNIIEALYFSMSGGNTQDVQSVFGGKVDYLVPVESIYDNKNINGYEVIVKIDKNKFLSKLNILSKEVVIDYIRYNDSDYVDSISVNGIVFNGNEFRNKLGLRSANFKINISDNIIITTYGFGHGVGLSQYGANGYAENGYNYIDILKHYYNNVEILNINNV